jgi:hypothetical protein
VLWALAQPAAALGLALAFLLGLGLRAGARRVLVRWLTGRRPAAGVPETTGTRSWCPAADVDPLGVVAVALGGTGWGRAAQPPPGGYARRAAFLACGPVAVLAASQLALAGFVLAYPGQRRALALNHPSDVLRGVVAPTPGEQVVLSVAVGLLGFGLVALLPVPPLDGFGLLWLLWSGPAATLELPAAVDRAGALLLLLLATVPVQPRSVLLMALDVVGAPLLDRWA